MSRPGLVISFDLFQLTEARIVTLTTTTTENCLSRASFINSKVIVRLVQGNSLSTSFKSEILCHFHSNFIIQMIVVTILSEVNLQ